MTPARLASALRSISDRILASSSPSRSAVTSELRRVLAAMEDNISKASKACPGANLSMIGQKIKGTPGYSGENWSIMAISDMIVENRWSGLDDDQLVSAIIETGVHQSADPTDDL